MVSQARSVEVAEEEPVAQAPALEVVEAAGTPAVGTAVAEVMAP
jgi:hypothetical protein